jgi:hypothetical protein
VLLARGVNGPGGAGQSQRRKTRVPSLPHEALLLLFRNRPTLAAEFLREVLHESVPSFKQTEIVSIDVTEVIPAERRADLVVLFKAKGGPVLAVIVEAHLHRREEKRYAWPVYVAGVRARYRCPTWLLVVTIDPKLVRWCSKPIELGHPGLVLSPLVVGPAGVPVITDAKQARATPELAVLSAMAHGRSKAAKAIGKAFFEAAAGLDPERAAIYSDLVVASLNEAARRSLEAMMKGGYEFQSELVRKWVNKGAEEGKLEGKLEGLLEAKAQDVLAVLEARKLEVPAEVRERVLASTDLAELDRWIRRAAVVSEARQLFESGSS